MRHVMLAIMSFCACLGQAETLMGVGYGGQAYWIDSGTGQGNAFGPGAMGLMNALAYHRGNYLAAGQGTELWSIDPVLGTSSVVATLTKADVRGLASYGGKLFGLFQGPTFDDPDLLAEINPTSGLVTTIGSLGWPYSAVQALAANGESLYAWDAVQGLVKVDAATGQASDVGTWSGTGEIQALEFLGDGTLVGGRDRLLKIDLGTGGWSLIGGGGYGDVRGLAAVPEPATWTALALGALIVRRRNRSK